MATQFLIDISHPGVSESMQLCQITLRAERLRMEGAEVLTQPLIFSLAWELL